MPISTSPSDEVITDVLRSLRSQLPTAGAAKLHSNLLAQNPEWAVSEKRVKRLLAENNLQLNPTPPSVKTSFFKTDSPRPSSRLVEGLAPSRWTPKIKVAYFGPAKGKGLVATQGIAEGEDIWKEDPFILAPEWEIYDLQTQSRVCVLCTTPFTSPAIDVSKTIPCPSGTNSSLPNAGACSARFCNRLCLRRAMDRTHPLLCPAMNPASAAVMTFVRQTGWLAAHAAVQSLAYLLLAHEQGRQKELEEATRFLDSLAQMTVEERWKVSGETGLAPNMDAWHKAHRLTVQALLEPPNARDKKVLGKILRKPIPEHLKKRVLDFQAYDKLNTSMSLNSEAHGGVYFLHSHMNHSCDPNVSVRHFDQKTALSRITVRARRAIREGEELTITYVDPSMPLSSRKAELMPWAFGTCQCSRCGTEAKETVEKDNKKAFGENGERAAKDLDGLEEELKHGLGIL